AYDLDGDAARLDEARRCVVTFARFHQRAPTAAATFMVVSARLAERMGKGTEGTDGTKGTARVQKGPVIIEGRFASTNEVEVRLVIEKGWHVNANKPSMDNLIATAVSADGVAKLKYPKPVKKKVGPDTLDVYEGDVVIRGEVASKGASAPLKISVTFQPCDDTRCLKPETVTLDVPTFITGM
ncbi:MAG TPA: protein-disulfide reductase DsbD domain-containing protein, partial [Kiritimatiellia bacterium]